MYPAGNVGELVSDLTTSALLIARGVHLRKHGKSPSGLRLRPRDAKEFCAPRRSDLCDAAHTPTFKFDHWPVMSDRIYPVLFFNCES
jgi:hypothetical protein